MEELFQMYMNLNMKERIKFDIEYKKYHNQNKKKLEKKKIKLLDDLNIINEENKEYFSFEWILKNYFKNNL